ncbi:MAG: ACS family sodium-dependent inorganic phosphate cotransporter [Candidatus Azotimanducaceae bacterium]|jgi:ACS family sodium-dependent inorganic phosphate cotransporter
MPERFKIIGLTIAAVFICYIDRVVISLTIIPMGAELGWSNTEKGIVLGSFYLAYMTTQIYGGVLSDKIGGKVVLGVGLVVWSVFTIITPIAAAAGFAVLILARLGMGLGEGITFPAWHSLYARWVPIGERSRSVAATNSAIPIGTVFGLLVTPVIIINLGWQWAFYLYGGIGFVWYYFWNKYANSLPKDSVSITAEELQYIEANAPAADPGKELHWKKWLFNRPLWAIAVAHFCNNYTLFVFLSWLPTFINEELGVELAALGFIAMLPHITSFIFVNVGGYFADSLIKRGVTLIRVRKLCNTIGFVGLAVCLCLIPEFNSTAAVMTVMCLGNVFSGFGAGGFIVNHADIGPKYTGRLMGITNTFAAIPGLVGGILTGIILDVTNSWDMVFYVTAGVTFFGGAFYLIFASTEKQFD